MIRIAIAEDNPTLMEATSKKLADFPVEIKIKAVNGRDLLRQLRLDPNIDLVLMDIQMPEMDGIEATPKVRELLPHVKVLVFTVFDDDDTILQTILSGASSYILKDENGERLFAAINDTLQGGSAMSPPIAGKVMRMLAGQPGSSSPPEENPLSPREMDILQQLKFGKTYRQIGSNLNISEGTVRKHIENIYRKLEVNNRTAALMEAGRKKII